MASTIEVAEEGNRRRGDMSFAEVEQCVLDIASWFDRAGLEVEGAPEALFQRLEKGLDADVPEELRVLLARINGGIWFYEFQALSIQGMVDVAARVADSGDWAPGLIPLASDPDENLLVVNTTRDDAVFEWDSSSGLGEMVGPSLCSYLERFRQDLLSSRYEFVEDCGVVEAAPSRGESKSSGGSSSLSAKGAK